MKKNGFLGTMRRLLPSPAMVVGCIALIVALGGTSYAAIRLPANSVGTKQLKNGAVTAAKVRSNSLAGTQINEGSLAQVPSAQRADEAAYAEQAETAREAARAPVARLDYRSYVLALPANVVKLAVADCPTGLNALSGGVHLEDPFHGNIADTFPMSRTAWAVHAFSTVNQQMTVFVVCAQAASVTP
jgi:hypothetical protein